MIVIDASAVIDLLLDLPPHADTIASEIARARSLAAPHLLDVEVAQVLRRRLLAGHLTAERADAALDDLSDLPLQRYPHGPLLRRAFELRNDATVYDGVYLALAEALESPLLTRDAALGAIPRLGARVVVLG